MANVSAALFSAVKSVGEVNRSVQEPPVVILWTDKEGQWELVVSRLHAELPQLLVLGDYSITRRTGPAIWLKCVIARALSEVTLPVGVVPILYLPGVSRNDLRAIESCPRHLQPIAELQYRGVFWTQVNAKDWTVNAFLSSKKGGLGLEVGQDKATQEAMLRALDALIDTPIEQLAGKHLKAADFDHLLVADPVRDVLTWMNDPSATRTSWGEGRWAAFVGRCRQDLGLHPEKDGELTAAERLAARQGAWAQVWERYAEAYARYSHVLDLLRRVSLPSDMFADCSGYPKANDDAEAALRAELGSFAQLTRTDAQKKLVELEGRHAERRNQLWTQMGLAPLAQALEHLAKLGALASTPLSGNVAEMAARYREQMWHIDSAAVSAMGCVHTKPDLAAVETVLRSLYLPWLEESAVRLQEQAKLEGGIGGSPVLKEPEPAAYVAGLCMVFVDGLRYDVAHRLVALLQAAGHDIQLDAAWTSVPSVTASGKPFRAKAADASSSMVDKAKSVQDSKASLVVSNDEAEGQAAFVVIYDEAGELLAKQHTVIGE